MEHRVSAHLPETLSRWGTVKVLGEATLRAGERHDLAIALTLSRPVPAGHSVEAWVHFVSNLQMLQLRDPSGEAYFACDCDTVPLRPEVTFDGPVHGPGSYFPYRRYAAARLLAEAPAGTVFIFRFQRLRQQTYEETLFNFRAVVMAGDRVAGYLGDAGYVVTGSAAGHLRVIAPTCIVRGEPFEVRIITRDRWGNKTGDDPGDWPLALTVGEGPGVLRHGTPVWDAACRLHRIPDCRLDTDGVHYLRATAGALTGESDPVVVRQSWAARLLWGDLHQHAYTGDGRGRPRANYLYARDHAGADFLSVAAHQELLIGKPLLHLDDYAEVPCQTGWEELVEATEELNGQGIITILGSEAGALGPIAGHMNSYFLDPRNRPELERTHGELHWSSAARVPRDFADYRAALEQAVGELQLMPHAHAGGTPDRYEISQPAYLTSVEIVSVHGIFEEFYHRWLANGRRVGVHGGGDNHMTSAANGNPGHHYPNTNGLTGAWARTPDRRGVWDAYRDRRTHAVTGNQRIFLEFSVDGTAMGGVASGGRRERRIALQVAGTSPLLSVELWRDGEVVAGWRQSVPEQCCLRLAWTDNVGSRRVDDSRTTGHIALPGASLGIRSVLCPYTVSDAFVEVDGTLDFRTNAYSGTPRGLICDVLGQPTGDLHFAIHDRMHDCALLDGSWSVPLGQAGTVLSRPLGTPERFRRALFTPEPSDHWFTLAADWVDPAGPRTLGLDWRDTAGPGSYYFVRLEQLDGNLAWSSPVWIAD